MPAKDGTGPMGNGPRGGGRGPCGQGMGRGRGMGQAAGNRFGRGGWIDRIRGRRNDGPQPLADQTALEEQIRMLESELQATRRQLEALKPAAKE